MQKIHWEGIDSVGQHHKGISNSQTLDELKSTLMQSNIALLTWKESSQSLLSKLKDLATISTKLKPNSLILFFENISTLIGSGISLQKTLSIFEKQTDDQLLKSIVHKVSADMEKGDSLSHAMSKMPTFFSEPIVKTVAVGERSGKLEVVFNEITLLLKEQVSLKNELKQALTMPMITFFMAMTIFSGIFLMIIPQFEELFVSMDKPIPEITKWIIGASSFMRTNLGTIFIFLTSFITLCILLPQRYEPIKKILSNSALKVPLISEIVISFNVVQFLQSFNMLLTSGIPAKQAIDGACGSIRNETIRSKMLDVPKLVEVGSSIEGALITAAEKYFPHETIAIISIGEQSGNLAKMLDKAKILTKVRLKNQLQFLITLATPTLVVIIGLMIAVFMLAVYLPIFSLASVL